MAGPIWKRMKCLYKTYIGKFSIVKAKNSNSKEQELMTRATLSSFCFNEKMTSFYYVVTGSLSTNEKIEVEY